MTTQAGNEINNVPIWIQAGAAVIQAAAAIIIFVVTRKYVRLTKTLADAATEQLKVTRLHQLAEDKQRASALRGRASSLEIRVSALPEQVDDTAFRTRALWTYEEIEGLQTAAAYVLGMAADAASRAAVELTWMRDRIDAIRAVSIIQGYDYARFFSIDEWRSRRAEALSSLRELMQLARIASDLTDEHAKRLSADANRNAR